MTLGYSTRAISAPVGTVGMYGPTMPATKFVPLSMFFLNMQDEGEEDSEGFYGKKKTDKKEKSDDKLTKKTGGKEKVSKRIEKQGVQKPKKPEDGGPEASYRQESSRFSMVEGKISKPQKCKYCDSPATKAYIWADGRAYIPVCDAHKKTAETRIVKKNNDEVTAIRAIPQKGQSTAAEQAPIVPPVLTPVKSGATRASSGAMGSGDIAQAPVPLGPLLRRVTPIGDEEKPKRKRRRLKGEELDGWIERLSEMMK